MSAKTVAIICDNLAGFILAAKLERSGHNAILIHTGDGATASLTSAIDDLDSLCGHKADPNNLVVESPPLTFEGNTAKPFVGFGESTKSSIQVLSKYSVTQRLRVTPKLPHRLSTPINDLINGNGLIGGLKAQRHVYTELGEFKFDGEIISKLTINAGLEISADHFVFMNSPQALLPLLPPELIGSRTRSRIAKTPIFTEIALLLEHPAPLYTGDNLIFLVPGNDQLEPVVGQCLSHFSIWLTYIKDELREDTEYVSTVIKGMRRQIRKAFSLNEDPTTASLTVTEQASADFAWLGEQKDIELIAKNLSVTPTLSSPFMGTTQHIDAADSAFAQIHRITVDLGQRHVLDLPM